MFYTVLAATESTGPRSPQGHGVTLGAATWFTMRIHSLEGARIRTDVGTTFQQVVGGGAPCPPGQPGPGALGLTPAPPEASPPSPESPEGQRGSTTAGV